MNEEMRAEAIEMSITACEKYAPNYEVRLQTPAPVLSHNIMTGLQVK